MEFAKSVMRKNGKEGENMNCKHCKVEGYTTKYYYCRLKNKAVDDYSCRNCAIKLPDLPEGFEELFGGLKR